MIDRTGSKTGERRGKDKETNDVRADGLPLHGSPQDMVLKCYRLNDQGFLEALSPEGLSSSWLDDGLSCWLDVEAASDDDLERLLAPFELHSDILEACRERTFCSRIELREGALFMHLPLQRGGNGEWDASLTVICLPTTLITSHDRPLPAVTRLTSNFSNKVHFNEASIPALVYHLTDHIVEDSFQSVAECRKGVEMLAYSFVDDPQSVEIEEIYDLRKQLNTLSSTSEDLSYCIKFLQAHESSAFRVNREREAFDNLARSADRILRVIERLEMSVRELHQYKILTLQETTNNRLRLLTIISALFLPLTLIAGIYGMNFERMPELSWSFGYPLVLGSMVLIGAGMLWFFYRRGWFD